MAYDLTNLYISQSYHRILQVSSSTVTDGTGSVLSSLYLNGDKIITQTNITAISSVTSSIASLNTWTGSASYRTGSFNGSFTGSFLGSIVSSSYSLSSSLSANSLLATSASYAVSSSLSTSSSFANSSLTSNSSVSSSFAQTASYVASVVSASYATTASYALNGGGSGTGFPYVGSALITGSLRITGSLNVVGPTTLTGSLNVQSGITGSLFGTSSWAVNSTSASYATSAASATNATLANNLSTIQVVQSGSTTSIASNATMFAGSGRIATGLTVSPAITVTGLSGTLFYNVFVTATATASAMTPGQAASVTVKSLVGNQLTFEGNQNGPYDFSFIGMYLI
jgi:hypothetical protein